MADTKFYLDNGLIICSHFIRKGDIMRMSTKEKIDSKYWNKKKYRATSNYRHSNKLNRLLDDITLFVKDTILDYKLQGKYIDGTTLKKELNIRLFGNDKTMIRNYITNVYLAEKEKSVESSTYKTYNNACNVIFRVLKSTTFQEINRHVCTQFRNELKNNNYADNYIHKIFSVFRSILKNSYIDKIHTNEYFMSSNFMPKTKDIESVYLDVDELNLMYNSLDTLNSRLKNATIIFLRGCYSGQRWQTYNEFKTEMVYTYNGVDMISIRQQKTSNQVSIPLSPKLKSLIMMETYNISRQKLSDYVKEVCKLLGIEKWEHISTHTARRTFATNMVLGGVDISKIMKITGHKTEKEFRKYVKIDHVQSAHSSISDVNMIFG